MSKIIILGAGASYGNGIGNEGDQKNKPPLVSNFFDSKKYPSLEANYTPLFEYLNTYTPQEKNIETIFSKIEGTWKLHLHDDHRAKEKIFGEAFICSSPPDWLKSYVCDIIRSNTSWLTTKSCPYHDKLVNKYLNVGDSIISFNYDLIVDKSLKSTLKWDETTGYGFPKKLIRKYYDEITESKYTLYKPHGSLNWFKGYSFQRQNNFFESKTQGNDNVSDKEQEIAILSIEEAIKGYTYGADAPNGCLNIVPNNYKVFKDLIKNIEKYSVDYTFMVISFSRDLTEGGFLPLIVVPTPYKPFDEMTYGEMKYVWQAINDKIVDCDELISFGFSFNDKHFNQILIESSLQRKKKLIIRSVTPNIIDHSDFNHSQIEFINEAKTLKEFVANI
ncbi:MAG: hypothetical protein NTU98_08140 [Bacteroidetes bacterium]|nr:hypothetical protein [Bacteroidota bacterium]